MVLNLFVAVVKCLKISECGEKRHAAVIVVVGGSIFSVLTGLLVDTHQWYVIYSAMHRACVAACHQLPTRLSRRSVG
jgi:hypothetical protein